MEGLFEAVRTNAKFLYSSFYGYTNQQVIDFFERINVPVKIERGDRVFPVSDRSSDVIRGLEREMDRLGVEVHLRTAVKKNSRKKTEHFEKSKYWETRRRFVQMHVSWQRADCLISQPDPPVMASALQKASVIP